MMTWSRKARLVAAWLLGLYFAKMYVQMGWVKFDPAGFWTVAFQHWGYPPWFRIVIGCLEVAGGICLLIPWVASYGALVLIVVMLGAWGTRAHDGRWTDVAWLTLYIAGLTWIAFEWWGTRLWRRRVTLEQNHGVIIEGNPGSVAPCSSQTMPGRSEISHNLARTGGRIDLE